MKQHPLAVPTSPLLFEALKDRIEYAAKTLKLEPHDVEMYARADPTTTGQYVLWISKQFKDKKLVFPEDVSKIRETLTTFDKVKNKAAFTGSRDLMSYKLLGDVAEAVEPFANLMSKRERIAKKAEDVERVAEHGPYVAFNVMSEEAASRLFRGSQWCVKDPSYFYNYHGYIYFEKDGQRFALYSESPQALMDLQDRPMNSADADFIECAFKASPAAGQLIAKRMREHRLGRTGPEAEVIDRILNTKDIETVSQGAVGTYETAAKANGIDSLSTRGMLTLALHGKDPQILDELAATGKSQVIFAMIQRSDLPVNVQKTVAEVLANGAPPSTAARVFTKFKELTSPLTDRLLAVAGYKLPPRTTVNLAIAKRVSSATLAQLVRNAEEIETDVLIAHPDKAVLEAVLDNKSVSESDKLDAINLAASNSDKAFIASMVDKLGAEKFETRPETLFALGRITKEQMMKLINKHGEIDRPPNLSLFVDKLSDAELQQVFGDLFCTASETLQLIPRVSNDQLKQIVKGIDDQISEAAANELRRRGVKPPKRELSFT